MSITTQHVISTAMHNVPNMIRPPAKPENMLHVVVLSRPSPGPKTMTCDSWILNVDCEVSAIFRV